MQRIINYFWRHNERCLWSSAEKIKALFESARIAWLNGRPYEKQYIEEAINSIPSILPFYSRQGTEDLKRLGLSGIFDTPKPVALIELLVSAMSYEHKNVSVLDYFAGSGTTAQACYQASMRTGCSIRYDLVQLDESIKQTSSIYDKAVQLGITSPTIADLTVLRVHTYLKSSGRQDDFDVIRLENK